MSDNWDSYFCTVDDATASIFVNLGLAQDLPMASLSHLASVRLRMRNPREDGLSSADEAPDLWRLEDALDSEVKSTDPAGIFVGRSTSGGIRSFFFYVPSLEGCASRIQGVVRKFPDYKIEVDVLEEPTWKTYFDFLLPNEEQRQTIGNRKVCERLAHRGDSLDQPREIDHWIYFRETRQREQFQSTCMEMGFQTRGLTDSPDAAERYGIQVYRVDLPSYGAIDDVTLPLFRLARACGGEYDGWET